MVPCSQTLFLILLPRKTKPTWLFGSVRYRTTIGTKYLEKAAGKLGRLSCKNMAMLGTCSISSARTVGSVCNTHYSISSTYQNKATTAAAAERNKRKHVSTSILGHSGNRLHDTDKIIFIVTELSKHIEQPASHDLPRKQQELQVSTTLDNAECWMFTAVTQLWQSCQVHYTHTRVSVNDRRARTQRCWAWKARQQELNMYVWQL